MGRRQRALHDSNIPSFALYGERGAPVGAEFVHIEDIRSRSQLYNWEIKSHLHRGLFQVVCLLDGGARVSVDELTTERRGPIAIAIPPATVHAFRFLPRTHGYVLTVAETMLIAGAAQRRRSIFDDLLREPRILDLAATPGLAGRVRALLDQIAAEFKARLPERPLMLEWLVRAALLLFARAQVSLADTARPDRARSDLFARFRALVEAHYREQWSVPAYAAALHVSESRLNRACRALADKSAFEVVQERMLLEARRRLIYISAPVSQLAYELGFQDAAYFCRFFKKHSGVTPTEFRRRARTA
jgi:AraC family transcriptional activator of pobA